MRICVVINSLGCGGAERVAATLANEWTRVGHDTSLVTLAAAADRSFYRLDSRIDRRGLDLIGRSTWLGAGISANVARVRGLRRELSTIRPDVIVSFIDCTNVLVLIAAVGLGIPVVVSERTDPRMSGLPAGWAALRRLTYSHATALVVQTQSVETWARRIVNPRRVMVIANPIVESCFQVEHWTTAGRARRVVGMGRLSHEKGFDLLIDAFALVSTRHPDWALVIAGEGPLANTLRERAERTRCADRIHFVGLVREPEQLLAGSEVFVLPSRHEGFPNALLEAMACGCSVIATDCRSGPAEIIRVGIDGVLVPVDRVEALAGSLEALMTDGAERRRLGAAAALSAARFQVEGIAEQWVGLFRAVSQRLIEGADPLADAPHLARER